MLKIGNSTVQQNRRQGTNINHGLLLKHVETHVVATVASFLGSTGWNWGAKAR